jgi:hypothetical protein
MRAWLGDRRLDTRKKTFKKNYFYFLFFIFFRFIFFSQLSRGQNQALGTKSLVGRQEAWYKIYFFQKRKKKKKKFYFLFFIFLFFPNFPGARTKLSVPRAWLGDRRLDTKLLLF